jgi:hypothetical protein
MRDKQVEVCAGRPPWSDKINAEVPSMETKYSGEEIGRRGQEIYEQRLRPLVETENNIGKIISIDVESGDYEIADDLLAAGRRLQQRRPDALMYGKRIGYNAVYAVGGSLVRTAP